MSMLVLGLNGSPRRLGNSETLLKEALRGTEAEGANVLQFNLAFMEISPCEACEECFRDGECVLLDEMCRLYDVLDQADAMIISSPIYFSGMSSQLKIVVDRCQVIWARRALLKNERKPGIGSIILVGAQPQARFDNALSELRTFLTGIGLRPTYQLTYGGMDRRDAASRDAKALSEAFEMGRKMGRQLTPGP
jgi:multimeric flavodoxin WrbA